MNYYALKKLYGTKYGGKSWEDDGQNGPKKLYFSLYGMVVKLIFLYNPENYYFTSEFRCKSYFVPRKCKIR